MNEKREAITSTKETLVWWLLCVSGLRGRNIFELLTLVSKSQIGNELPKSDEFVYFVCRGYFWKDRGTVLCPNPSNII